jgi:hypothetical protein
MEDWLEDLKEFPAMFVAEACREWRQDLERGQWRPTPTDIRRLAIEARHAWELRKAPPRPRLAPPSPEPVLSEEEAIHRRHHMGECMGLLGKMLKGEISREELNRRLGEVRAKFGANGAQPAVGASSERPQEEEEAEDRKREDRRPAPPTLPDGRRGMPQHTGEELCALMDGKTLPPKPAPRVELDDALPF